MLVLITNAYKESELKLLTISFTVPLNYEMKLVLKRAKFANKYASRMRDKQARKGLAGVTRPITMNMNNVCIMRHYGI